MAVRYGRLLASLIIFLYSACLYAAGMSEVFRNPNDPVVGDKNGKVTVVEFFDYRCKHCVAAAHAVDATIKANPDVRFVFKEFPVFGHQSELGAKAALAANMQGKYYPFHLALITSNKKINNELITNIAKELDLNVDQLKKDMNSKKVADQIKSINKMARSIKIRGTPTFFIVKTNATNMNDSKYFLGEVTEKQLNNAIKEVNKS